MQKILLVIVVMFVIITLISCGPPGKYYSEIRYRNPVFSPDGKKIAFILWDYFYYYATDGLGGKTERSIRDQKILYIYDIESGDSEAIYDCKKEMYLNWHPNGYINIYYPYSRYDTYFVRLDLKTNKIEKISLLGIIDQIYFPREDTIVIYNIDRKNDTIYVQNIGGTVINTISVPTSIVSFTYFDSNRSLFLGEPGSIFYMCKFSESFETYTLNHLSLHGIKSTFEYDWYDTEHLIIKNNDYYIFKINDSNELVKERYFFNYFSQVSISYDRKKLLAFTDRISWSNKYGGTWRFYNDVNDTNNYEAIFIDRKYEVPDYEE